MVMGRDSHTKGHGFDSQHRILDGHFSHLFCCKNCNYVCLKRSKINEKEAKVGPFLRTCRAFLYGLKRKYNIMSSHD